MNKAGKEIKEELEESPVKKEENSPEMNDLMEKLLKGEEIYEVIDTNRGKFKMIYPRPSVLRKIQVLLASRFHGQNLNLIQEKVVRNCEVYATLDIIITEAPAWWDKLDSSEDCPDDSLILQLYRGYLRFYGKIQQRIGSVESKPGKDTEKQPGKIKKEAVGTGAFSGITNRPEDAESNR